MSARFLLVCTLFLIVATNANAARYQRTRDGKTLVWNNLRSVAQDAAWSGLRDTDGYATGEGTLSWYRLGNEVVNSYTGKMVRGKLEGAVIKEQGQTRLQATFANGEQVSGWSEPGRTGRAATTSNAAKKEESPPSSETETIESEEPSESAPPSATQTPTPRPTPRSTPRVMPTASAVTRLTPAATPTPAEPIVTIPTPPALRSSISTPTATEKAILLSTPIATPRSTATVTVAPSRTPLATPTPTAKAILMSTPTATASLTPPKIKSTSTATPGAMPSFAPHPESVYDLPSRSSSPRNALGATSPDAKQNPPSAMPNASAAKNPAVKKQMIADFKQRTATVLKEMKEATEDFKPIEHLDEFKNLPSSVSANVTYLSVYAQQFNSTVGHDTAYYECLDQVETVAALILAEEATRDLANKDTPAARKALASFANKTAEPPPGDRNALARYLNSIFFTCEKAKAEAEPHLQQAKTLEAAGKKSEALNEYLEIDRIYPNPTTAAKIKKLKASQ